MQIDPEITKRCAEQARIYRELERQHGISGPPTSNNLALTNSHSPTLLSMSTRSIPHTPTTPRFKRQFKKIMPKPLENSPSGFASDVSSPNGGGGGVEGSQDETERRDDDDDDDDRYVLSSPASQHGGGGATHSWSAINSPDSLRSPSPKIKFRDPFAQARSPASSTRSDSPNGGGSRRKNRRSAARHIPRSYAPLDTLPPPYKPLYPVLAIRGGEGASGSKGKDGAGAADESDVSPAPKAHHRHHRRHMDLDEDYDAGSDDSDTSMDLTGPAGAASGSGVGVGVGVGGDKRGGSATARKKSTKAFTDFNAALVLMQMRDVSSTMSTGLRRLKRPASL